MLRLRGIERALANFYASAVPGPGGQDRPFLWQFPPNFRYEHDRFAAFLDLFARRRLHHPVAPAAGRAGGGQHGRQVALIAQSNWSGTVPENRAAQATAGVVVGGGAAYLEGRLSRNVSAPGVFGAAIGESIGGAMGGENGAAYGGFIGGLMGGALDENRANRPWSMFRGSAAGLVGGMINDFLTGVLTEFAEDACRAGCSQ